MVVIRSNHGFTVPASPPPSSTSIMVVSRRARWTCHMAVEPAGTWEDTALDNWSLPAQEGQTHALNSRKNGPYCVQTRVCIRPLCGRVCRGHQQCAKTTFCPLHRCAESGSFASKVPSVAYAPLSSCSASCASWRLGAITPGRRRPPHTSVLRPLNPSFARLECLLALRILVGLDRRRGRLLLRPAAIWNHLSASAKTPSERNMSPFVSFFFCHWCSSHW